MKDGFSIRCRFDNILSKADFDLFLRVVNKFNFPEMKPEIFHLDKNPF